jgi:hypothetical protein
MADGQADKSKRARSAAALRANLARRKAQARERLASGDAGSQQIGAERGPAPGEAASDPPAGTLSPQKPPRRTR